MKVTAQYAIEHFEDLAVAVDGGEVVEIERQNKPALQLVRSAVTVEAAKLRKTRVLGAGTAFLRTPSEEEWNDMDREWRKSFAEKFGD